MATGTSDGLRLTPSPGTHRTLAEQAYARLHSAIVTGEIAAGERLPIEEPPTCSR